MMILVSKVSFFFFWKIYIHITILIFRDFYHHARSVNFLPSSSTKLFNKDESKSAIIFIGGCAGNNVEIMK